MEEVRERFQNLHEIVAAARAKARPQRLGLPHRRRRNRDDRSPQPLGASISLALRPRILRNVGSTDTSGTFLGRKLKMPVALAPIGSIERFDPAATAAVANAAGTFGCAMFQSSVSKPELEETAQGSPDGPEDFPALRARRSDLGRGISSTARSNAGFGALCLTVDTHHYSRRERDISKRYSRSLGAHRRACEVPEGSLDWAQFDKLRRRTTSSR